MTGPRVVFGMPAYGRVDTLAQVLESLLSQTCRDFAVVIVDDRPSAEAEAIVRAYEGMGPRLVYEANPVRLGMIGNWRRAFDRSRVLYPDSELFAWVSDHDAWHPRWLEVLVRALDEHPSAVLAYPLMQRVFPDERKTILRIFETVGMARPVDRLRALLYDMTAGNCIYGLFRAATLARAGVFRPVLMPDKQLLIELSFFGEFKHVPEVLWYREVAGMFSFRRQRQMFFTGRSPLYTYLPANVQHFGVLLWDLAVLGKGRPAFGRLRGAWYAALHLAYSTARALTHDDAAWRGALDVFTRSPRQRARGPSEWADSGAERTL